MAHLGFLRIPASSLLSQERHFTATRLVYLTYITAALSIPLITLSACGGPKQETKTASDEESEPHTDNLGTYPDSGETEEVDPGCQDGTCFACGDGLCPKGAYCDQDARGGPACAWVSECPGAPTCACLAKVLGSSCDCDENGGGPLIDCQ